MFVLRPKGIIMPILKELKLFPMETKRFSLSLKLLLKVAIILISGIMYLHVIPKSGMAIDYEEFGPEELEIIYYASEDKTDILPFLCEAYARFYMGRSEIEWWADGGNYKLRVAAKFEKFCAAAYDKTKSRSAACYLQSHYSQLAREGKPVFARLAKYVRHCSDNNTYKNFLKADACIMAIVEHLLKTVKNLIYTPTDGALCENVGDLIKVLGKYRSDLSRYKDKSLLFAGEAQYLEFAIDNIHNPLAEVALLCKHGQTFSLESEASKEISIRIRWLALEITRSIETLSEPIIKAAAALGEEAGNRNSAGDIKALKILRQNRDVCYRLYDNILGAKAKQ